MPSTVTSRRLLALLPGLLLVVLGSVGFGVLLDAVNERDDLSGLDQPVLEWLADHRYDWLTSTFTAITTVFGPYVLPVIVAVACGIWGAVTRRWRDPVMLVGAMLLSVAISTAVKALVARPRPADDLQTVPGVESSFSFPSGHTIGAATLVLVGGYLLWREVRTRRFFVEWTVVSAVVVVVVAASRLYLGYHFVTDVLAGICLAVVTLGVVVAVDRFRGAGVGAPLGEELTLAAREEDARGREEQQARSRQSPAGQRPGHDDSSRWDDSPRGDDSPSPDGEDPSAR